MYFIIAIIIALIAVYADQRKPYNKTSKIKLYKKEPTFEEWKANKQKQETDSTPMNTTTERGTYRYNHIHLAGKEVHIPKAGAAQTPSSSAMPKRPNTSQQEHKQAEKPKTGYEEAYEATPILTYNESRNFATLQAAAYRKGYMICPKVRLADIVKPRNDEKYKAHFDKIKSKHVDFVICNSKMDVLAVIELDDKSHDRPDRQKRDEFVDSILEANGIKVIHTRHITEDILDDL